MSKKKKGKKTDTQKPKTSKAKPKQVCGACKKPGHNARMCGR